MEKGFYHIWARSRLNHIIKADFRFSSSCYFYSKLAEIGPNALEKLFEIAEKMSDFGKRSENALHI